MFAPKRSNLARWCEKIDLLQHVIYSKHGNWLKLWNFHLSKLYSAELFSRIQHQDIPQVQITDLRSKSKIDNLPY